MNDQETGRAWRRAVALSAEDAGWSIREAAWDLEERVLWRSSDATRSALGRVGYAIQPLQRLIQTRVTWPIGDALRARSGRTRMVIAAGAATMAIAVGVGGAISASHHPSVPGPLPAASVTPTPQGDVVALQGVTPQFQAGHAAAPAPQPPTKASAPPAQVAWQFAQAFVGYEVGHSSKATTQAFNSTATKPLAKSLATDPPRLPANGKVPRARVLNVVLGASTKQQVTASVSLVRLRTMSELRLTLTRNGDEWRVAQVLG